MPLITQVWYKHNDHVPIYNKTNGQHLVFEQQATSFVDTLCYVYEFLHPCGYLCFVLPDHRLAKTIVLRYTYPSL